MFCDARLNGWFVKYRRFVNGDVETEAVYLMVDSTNDVDFFDAQGHGYVLMCEHEV